MITGVVLAHNEEQHIEDCLKSLRPHVRQLILIDADSSDRTRERARPYVDKLMTQQNVPGFDAIRNVAIEESDHDWLWFVDADERVPEATGSAVNELVSTRGNDFEAISIPFRSYFCGRWIRGCRWWPGYTMPRVLKRGHFRFADRIHGGVELSGRQVQLAGDPALAIDHFSYDSIEHYLTKCNRYTSAEARELAKQGRRHNWRSALEHMMHELWLSYERKQGYVDGEHGWILSWLSGQYRWLSHAKLLDFGEGRPSSSDCIPPNLDAVIATLDESLHAHRAHAPELPLGIELRGPVWDASGYADECRAFAKALASSDRRISLVDLKWSNSSAGLCEVDRRLLRSLLNAKKPRYSAEITDCIPTLSPPPTSSSLKVLRTTFETDRIPQDWHPHLASFDEIWVTSEHNYCSFVRSWVPPEKLRVVPSCIDDEIFCKDGRQIKLPRILTKRFVFLSVFDWQLRKGWDVLLDAYCREFGRDDGIALLLKVTRHHGQTWERVRADAVRILAGHGETLRSRPDIVFWDKSLTMADMAALYRSVDAFVLASRGEGWGRPYMEAMASGLPTIGSNHSGNLEFMDDSCSWLINGQEVDVPQEGWIEIPPYQGHKWFEPNVDSLRTALREVASKATKRRRVADRGAEKVRSNFNLSQGRHQLERALAQAEAKFRKPDTSPPSPTQACVFLEGELFARHSFANINEQLAQRLGNDSDIALSVRRRFGFPAHDEDHTPSSDIHRFVERDLGGAPDVTIRHAFPPNWEPVECGAWVHIQPWEFGHLPMDWIAPLRDGVDEIWAPSHYVRRVYERSGIDASKIHVIPWGIDANIFRPDAIPLLLPCKGSFRFLFVGGIIPRKGFDCALEAYLTEFTRADDVTLVIKSMGAETFYKNQSAIDRIYEAISDDNAPEIVYLDHYLTQAQMPSLYAACHCFVAPYRGEGFGLPILEAMACGVPPIVPQGGPTDDYISKETGFVLPAREVESSHVWPLCGPAYELDVSVGDARKAMRRAAEDPCLCQTLGRAASKAVRENFTWERTAASMKHRIKQLATNKAMRAPSRFPSRPKTPVHVAVVLVANDATGLARRLALARPFVDELVVLTTDADEQVAAVAGEYEARVFTTAESSSLVDAWRQAVRECSADWVWLPESMAKWPLREVECVHLRRHLGRLCDDVEMGVVIQDSSSAALAKYIRNRADVVDVFDPFADKNKWTTARAEAVARLSLESLESPSPDGAAPERTNAAVGVASRLATEPWLEPWAKQQGRIFIDVGANIGAWTRWLASSFLHVHAIEPNPAAVDQLKAELPPNVTVHEVAAWDQAGTVSFAQFERSVHLSAYFRTEGINTGRAVGTIELPAVRIDDLEISGPVDFLKCDVEGAEVKCLRGAEETIRRDRPWLLIEIHSVENFAATTALLATWGYAFSVVRDPNYEPFSSLWYAHCWLSCQPVTSEIVPSGKAPQD